MLISSGAAATRSTDDRLAHEVSYPGTNNDERIMEVEDEVGDSSASPNDVAEIRNDLSKEMDLEGHNSHLGSGSSSGEKSKVRLRSDALAVGEIKGNFRASACSNKPFKREKKVPKDSSCPMSGKNLTLAKDNESQDSKKDREAFQKGKTSQDYELHASGESQFCSSEILNAKTTSPFRSMRGRLEGTSGEEIKQMGMHSGDDKQRMASRSASPALRTRSLSPGAEIKDGIKRPAVICDFFTKGWCIKGNSCRFLHLKDDTNNTSRRPKEDVAAATEQTDAQFNEGLTNITDRSRFPCLPEPLASSVRNHPSMSSDLSLERILPQEPGESKRLPQFQESHTSLRRENIFLGNIPSSQRLASSRDDIGVTSSFKDVGREVLRQNCSADNYGNLVSLITGGSSPIFRSCLLPEYRSSPSPYVVNDYSSLSRPTNSSLSTSGPSGGNLSSHYASAWIRSSLPFSSSSLNASPLGAQKLLEGDRQCHTTKSSSLLRSTSPVCGSDWEPSVPFRPSFFLDPQSISFPGSQYDPLRGSLDSPKIGDISLKVSLSTVRGSSINTPHQQIYGDSMLSRTIVPECNGDKSSVSSQGGFRENVLDNNCHTPGKDSYTGGEEAVGTSAGAQNVAMPKEDDPSVSTCVKDISKSKKLDINCDHRHQNDGYICNKDLKADRVKQNNEMDLEHKTDRDVHKESKAMRHLRADLVDLVKELLKPTWRAGKLSKDAHNRIVKKAVDKVLSALQPHQVPTTVESVKQYLSSSQPKIAKLVEGYVDKYGKS